MKKLLAARLHIFGMVLAGRRAIYVNEASPEAIVGVEIGSMREVNNSEANRAV
jgi:hypothetical protein